MRRRNGKTWWGGVKFNQVLNLGEKRGVQLTMTEGKWEDLGEPDELQVSIHRSP